MTLSGAKGGRVASARLHFGLVFAGLLAAGALSACGEVIGGVDVETGSLEPDPVATGGTGGSGSSGGGAGGTDPGPTGAVGGASSEGVPELEGVCLVGAVRCDGAALQLCAPDGSRWITTSICGTPALCSVDPPACTAPTCALDELSCDGATLRACNADRNGWIERETCASAAHCRPDSRTCLAAPCSEGELACNQGALSRCRDDELGWVPLESCATQELCELARAQGDNGCVDPGCEVGERRCADGQLLLCNDGRTGFDAAEQCTNQALCERTLESGSATCEAPECAADELRCTPEGALQRCAPDLDGFETIETCASPELCEPSLGVGGCLVPACDPGDRRCNGADLEVCNAGRTGFELEDVCASAALCVGNARCEDPACQPGEAECQSRRVLLVCNADLTGFDEVRCGGGILGGCDDDADPPACGGLFGAAP